MDEEAKENNQNGLMIQGEILFCGRILVNDFGGQPMVSFDWHDPSQNSILRV